MELLGGSLPPLETKIKKMIAIEQQIKFIESKIKKLNNNKALLKAHKMKSFSIDNEICYLFDLLGILKCICNEKALQFAECEVCGSLYISKREKQAVCSGKCRTRLHRERKEQNK